MGLELPISCVQSPPPRRNLFPRAGRVKGCASTSLSWHSGSKNYLPRISEIYTGGPRSPSGSGHNLKLCALVLAAPSAPPKTLRTLQRLPFSASLITKCLRQPSQPWAQLQTFPPLPPIPTQGAPSRLLERGSYPGRTGGRERECSVPDDHLAVRAAPVGCWSPRLPGAPTQTPTLGQQAQHHLLPSSR